MTSTQDSMTESDSPDERPLKRVRADSIAGTLDGHSMTAFRPAPKVITSASMYQEAEAALEKLTLLDRDQAVHLLKTHPEVTKLLHAANTQASLVAEEAKNLVEMEADIQDLVQEKDQLEAALNKEVEVHEKEKQALEGKIKSSTLLCTKMLQQNVAKLENSLGDLRQKVFSRATFETRRMKDDEIARLHRLVGEFADKILSDFQSSLSVASKMLGKPTAQSATNIAQVARTPRKEIAPRPSKDSPQSDHFEDGDSEDEDSEYEEPIAEAKQSTKNKKLYDTEYVDRHSNENFFHRASGRWMKGLPSMEASIFTGVRGPGAQEWKSMKEKYEANKPKEDVRAETCATPKRNEQHAVKVEKGNTVKFENMMPAPDKVQALASARKIQQLETTIHDLHFKLKELRTKLEEEVRARRKAEAELESIRSSS